MFWVTKVMDLVMILFLALVINENENFWALEIKYLFDIRILFVRLPYTADLYFGLYNFPSAGIKYQNICYSRSWTLNFSEFVDHSFSPLTTTKLFLLLPDVSARVGHNIKSITRLHLHLESAKAKATHPLPAFLVRKPSLQIDVRHKVCYKFHFNLPACNLCLLTSWTFYMDEKTRCSSSCDGMRQHCQWHVHCIYMAPTFICQYANFI